VIALGRWLSPEGKSLLVSLGKDRTLRLWDPGIGRLVRFVKFPHVPLRMKISTSGSVRVLLENNSVANVSLPMLGLEETEVLDPTGLWAWYFK
jgi:WD40 repeat protein